MRLILLEVCTGITALLFLLMLCAIARHRGQRRSEGTANAPAISEYLWAIVPWVIFTACALPAVRLIATGH
ncbi:MAG: cytochrome c oxidase subunit II transmembrane domain-containing protein [Steroidobacteraceae bacterium]